MLRKKVNDKSGMTSLSFEKSKKKKKKILMAGMCSLGF